MAWGSQAAVAAKMTPKARLRARPTRAPRTIAGASSVSADRSGWPRVSSSTSSSAARLTREMVTMARTSAPRFCGDVVASSRTRWNTMLPAAAAAIHWATLKQALTGWIRCSRSDNASDTPTMATKATGGRRNTAGARIASNGSMVATWPRYWNSRGGKGAAVSRMSSEITVGHDGIAPSSASLWPTSPPTMPAAPRAAVNSSTGTAKAPSDAFPGLRAGRRTPLLPGAVPGRPGQARTVRFTLFLAVPRRAVPPHARPVVAVPGDPVPAVDLPGGDVPVGGDPRDAGVAAGVPEQELGSEGGPEDRAEDGAERVVGLHLHRPAAEGEAALAVGAGQALVGHARRGREGGGVDVDHPGPDGHRVAGGGVPGRGHQGVLDPVGGEAGVGLEHQGDRAGHDPGGHGGAASAPIGPVDVVGEPGVDGAARGAQGDHMGARGDNVRLRHTLGGRAAAGEVGQLVVVEGGGAPVVGGPDRDHPRVVGRLGDGLGGGAVVAGRDDHGHAGRPGPLDRVVERVDPPVLGRVGAEAEVEHPDVVALLEGDHPLDGGQDVADVGGAVGPGDLHRQDPGAWRDALPLTAGAGAVAGDQPGDEGAVPVAVVAVELARQVLAGGGLAGEVVADLDQPAGQVGQVGGDAGVEHGHGDAAAGDPALPGGVGPDDRGVDRADVAGAG